MISIIKNVKIITIFGIYSYVLIELLYCILVEDVMISHLNLYIVIKKDF